MARTIQEIQAQITAEKTATPELSGLNSVSQTAIYKLTIYVVAVAIAVHEAVWDVASKVLQAKADTLHVGTALWYINEAKKFEVGNNTLSIDINTYQVKYSVSVPANQLIKYAAVVGQGRLTVLKVAKQVSGLPAKLTNTELAEFAAYLDRIKFAGAQIVAQSLDADLLKCEGTVYYDGARYSLATVQTAVETAINTYLNTLSFNGALYRNALIDAVQKVAGVTDIDVDVLQGKADAAPSYTDIDRLYLPLSGSIKVGVLNINYVAE